MSLFTIFAAASLATLYPPANGSPVIDSANVIEDQAEKQLAEDIIAFEKQHGRQVVVATVNQVVDDDIETYAEEYFERLGVGSKETNDGVLFLVAPNQRKMRIEVGYGLEPVLTDMASAQALDLAKPDFRNGDFTAGIVKVVKEGIQPRITTTAIEKAAEDKRKADEAAYQAWMSFQKFLSWVGIVLGGVFAVGVGGVVATIQKRRRQAAEAAAKKAAEDAAYQARRKEEERRYAERRAREAAEREKQRREWEEYLKNETPAQRAAREAKDAVDRAAELERKNRARREQEERDRQRAVREKAEAERRRTTSSSSDDYYRRSSSSYGGSSSSSYDFGSSSSSWSSGGGDSGGGGASSDW